MKINLPFNRCVVFHSFVQSGHLVSDTRCARSQTKCYWHAYWSCTKLFLIVHSVFIMATFLGFLALGIPKGRLQLSLCHMYNSVSNLTFLHVFQLYQQGRLCQLGGEFCELEVFAKVLRASDKRYLTPLLLWLLKGSLGIETCMA